MTDAHINSVCEHRSPTITAIVLFQLLCNYFWAYTDLTSAANLMESDLKSAADKNLVINWNTLPAWFLVHPLWYRRGKKTLGPRLKTEIFCNVLKLLPLGLFLMCVLTFDPCLQSTLHVYLSYNSPSGHSLYISWCTWWALNVGLYFPSY